MRATRLPTIGAVLVAGAAWLMVWACGSGSPGAPSQSKPVSSQASPPATCTLAGVVSNATTTRPVQGGTVQITSGPNAGRQSTTDSNGYYSIPALAAGTFTLHATASGYNAVDQTVSIASDRRFDFTMPPVVPATPQCDASLWNHVHDPIRLKMIQACVTVTGVIMEESKNDDGDIDLPIAVDPPFANLLNGVNHSKLHGWLQVEAICQAPIHPDVPDSYRACRDFTGTVAVPPVGTRIQVTGSYTLDQDHGWTEVHPATTVTPIQ